AVLRFLATLGPQDRGAAVLERLMRIVTQFLEGAAQNLEGEGPAREGAPPSMARRARVEALDAIIAVLADEVDRIDQEEEFPETFKERREALASIIGILTREKASAGDKAEGGGRIRRVPVE
ncbi:MAG: hypothetical protein K8I02_11440, partial [Candidatus Methylomirabilis sp.]|nr:hypothetical protein [Deltaproteobacteria bacterium]